MSTSCAHAPYGRRHVVPSAVSIAGVYASPAKLVIAGMYALLAPTVDEAGFLPISAGKASCRILFRYDLSP